jgi:hypothetical protein
MKNNDEYVKDLLKLKPRRMRTEGRDRIILGFKNYSIYFEPEPFGDCYVFYVCDDGQSIYSKSCEISDLTFQLVKDYYFSATTDDLKKAIDKETRKSKIKKLDKI